MIDDNNNDELMHSERATGALVVGLVFMIFTGPGADVLFGFVTAPTLHMIYDGLHRIFSFIVPIMAIYVALVKFVPIRASPSSGGSS